MFAIVAMQAEKQSTAVGHTNDGKDDGKRDDVPPEDLHQCLVVHTRDPDYMTEQEFTVHPSTF